MKKWISVILTVILLFTCAVTAFAEEEEELIELYIQMTVTVEDGVIKADLVDSQQGTVSTWPVSLEIDGEQVDTVNTDEYGTATFYYAIPEETQKIACVAHDGQYDNYRFIGCTVYVDYAPPADEEVTEPSDDEQPDETQQTTEPTHTTTSIAVATTTTKDKSPANAATMTTTVKGDRVAISVVPDNALLIASGSTLTDYQSQARMWMDHNLYRSLVPPTTSSLQLHLALDAQAGEQTRLIAAKNADPAFSAFSDEDVKGFAMTLSIVYVDDSATVPLDIEDSVYTIEMPVPAILKNAKKLALAVCTSDGLAQLIEVKPSGNVMNFTVQRFQTLALVGFGSNAASMNSLFDTPWLLVLVIILGLVMIASGIVLLIFVVFRRKKVESTEESAAEKEPATRVSLDADDEEEDEVFVAPPPAKPQPVRVQPPETQAVCQTSVPAVETPVVPASVPSALSVSISTDEIDDLLDEVLSDLDNE